MNGEFIYILITHYIKGFEEPESDTDIVKISSKNLRKGGCVNLQQKQIISERFRYKPRVIQKEVHTIPINISVADLLFVSTKNLISSSETRMVFSNPFLLKRHLKGCYVQQKM